MVLAGLKAFGERTVATTAAWASPSTAPPCLPPAAPPSRCRRWSEVGVGIHGEPGRTRAAFEPADRIADLLCAEVLADLAAPADAPVLLFVNGFGGTPASELYLMYLPQRGRGWNRAGSVSPARSSALM